MLNLPVWLLCCLVCPAGQRANAASAAKGAGINKNPRFWGKKIVSERSIGEAACQHGVAGDGQAPPCHVSA